QSSVLSPQSSLRRARAATNQLRRWRDRSGGVLRAAWGAGGERRDRAVLHGGGGGFGGWRHADYFGGLWAYGGVRTGRTAGCRGAADLTESGPRMVRTAGLFAT